MDTVEQQKSVGSTKHPYQEKWVFKAQWMTRLNSIFNDIFQGKAGKTLESFLEEAIRYGESRIPPPFPPDAEKIRTLEQKVGELESILALQRRIIEVYSSGEGANDKKEAVLAQMRTINDQTNTPRANQILYGRDGLP
jgi:hypothetical protein